MIIFLKGDCFVNHSWLYIESQGLCILALSVLLVYNLRYWKPNIFNYLFGVYLLAIITTALDITRSAIGGKPENAWILHIVIVLYSTALAFMGYFWFCYCTEQLPFHFWKNKNVRVLFMIPAIFVCTMAVLSVHTEWFYYIDEFGHSHNSNLYFLELVDYVYIVVSSVLSFIAYKRAEYEREKNRYLMLTSFIILPVSMITIEIIWPQNNLLVLSHVILNFLLILFISDQHYKILIDTLTGLPNRYGFDVALQHSLEQAKNTKGKSSFSLIIGDLDEFKKINDTWGHPEGDRALTMTAKFLSKCSQQYNAAVYRMGGDEFAIIVNSNDPASAQALCDNIQSSIRSIAFRDDCELSMSLGHVVYDGTMNSIELLNQADAKLYEEKASKKSILF